MQGRVDMVRSGFLWYILYASFGIKEKRREWYRAQSMHGAPKSPPHIEVLRPTSYQLKI